MKLCSIDILICDMIYKKSWKYILIRDDSFKCNTLNYYCLKAVKDFGYVRKGELGGYVQGYNKLSQSGNSWIYQFMTKMGI